MTILITADGEFITEKGESPAVGKRYQLEPADDYSTSQRKTFEALITCFFVSGCYTYDVKTREELRAEIKKEYGEGYEWAYPKECGEIGFVKERENAPLFCQQHGLCFKVLKSTTRYTKKGFTDLLNNLIALMDTCGVQTKKYYEILDGMA